MPPATCRGGLGGDGHVRRRDAGPARPPGGQAHARGLQAPSPLSRLMHKAVPALRPLARQPLACRNAACLQVEQRECRQEGETACLRKRVCRIGNSRFESAKVRLQLETVSTLCMQQAKSGLSRLAAGAGTGPMVTWAHAGLDVHGASGQPGLHPSAGRDSPAGRRLPAGPCGACLRLELDHTVRILVNTCLGCISSPKVYISCTYAMFYEQALRRSLSICCSHRTFPVIKKRVAHLPMLCSTLLSLWSTRRRWPACPLDDAQLVWRHMAQRRSGIVAVGVLRSCASARQQGPSLSAQAARRLPCTACRARRRLGHPSTLQAGRWRLRRCASRSSASATTLCRTTTPRWTPALGPSTGWRASSCACRSPCLRSVHCAQRMGCFLAVWSFLHFEVCAASTILAQTSHGHPFQAAALQQIRLGWHDGKNVHPVPKCRLAEWLAASLQGCLAAIWAAPQECLRICAGVRPCLLPVLVCRAGLTGSS